MAWVAFDRAVKDVERLGLDGPSERWRALGDRIHAEICERAFNVELNSFVQHYDGRTVDASLLLLPIVGFLPVDDPRIAGTVSCIEERLMLDGFVHRYSHDDSADGLPAGEGAFILCTWWLADVYAMQGRHAEAEALVDRLMAIRNDLGLLAEEYDPVAGSQLGNFPQAFSHIGLINTVRNLWATGGPSQERAKA
jgi:GH15 family glucan-1,4-alpha-glucosidase